MAKKTTVFPCTECGAQSSKWLGRCPDCGAWNTFLEERPPSPPGARSLGSRASSQPLTEVDGKDVLRLSTHIASFDRVLGGGLVEGGVVLVGGEPGIGKSTLLLQVANLCDSGHPVLYVSGEESPRQIVMRARRIGAEREHIHLFSETSIERIVEEIERLKPSVVIIDSIQTTHTSANPASAGSIGQVRDCAGLLLIEAKRRSISIFLIGHVTKEGTIAGPKALEHIVDTVLYFEGDRFRHFRLIRAVKNRFGPVNEVAIFEMRGDGLEEVEDPSRAMIAERSKSPGSAIAATIEGTRPLLVEIQGLVSPTHFPSPKRMAMGFDSNRLALLLAVLEKLGGVSFLDRDVYLNVAGGLEVDEPAVDLGVVAALVSSQQNLRIPSDVAIFGEVGLLGEVRGVSHLDARVREAAALGFRRLVIPKSNSDEIRSNEGVIGVRSVEEFLEAFRMWIPAV